MRTLLLVFTPLLTAATRARAEDLRVLAAAAMQSVFEDVGSDFERAGADKSPAAIAFINYLKGPTAAALNARAMQAN